MIVLHKQPRKGDTVTKRRPEDLRNQVVVLVSLTHTLVCKWAGSGTKGILDSSLIDHKYRFFFFYCD